MGELFVTDTIMLRYMDDTLTEALNHVPTLEKNPVR
jgi:hypothetical protein